jgi:hypothetical protein
MQNQMNKAIPILFATNIAAFLGILSILVLPGFVHPDRLGVPRSNLLADVLGSLYLLYLVTWLLAVLAGVFSKALQKPGLYMWQWGWLVFSGLLITPDYLSMFRYAGFIPFFNLSWVPWMR